MTLLPPLPSGSLAEVLANLQTNLGSYPRRVPGELTLEQRPFRFVDLHSFYHQAMQIFAHNLYDFESQVPNPLIIDCGAHIGLATLYFKQRYPNSRILAFEADPGICEILRFNLASFGVSNAEVNQRAVWVHDQGVVFDISSDDAGMVQGVNPQVQEAQATHVPSQRLKTLLEQAEVELVKLDIEGAEFAVIPDCAESLRQSRCYLIEAHIFGYPQKLGVILSSLEKYGFRYVLSDLHQAAWLPLDSDKPRPPFRQAIADKFIVTIFAWRI
jgi:FkbM family methyltransferase